MDVPSVGVKEHDLGQLSKRATWPSEEVETAWRESGATVQNLKRGCVGREFLTSAGLAALVDNENADDWMARLSVLKTSIIELSSHERISVVTRRSGIETTRRFIQVSWMLGPFKSNDCDRWNRTRTQFFFCFDSVEHDPAWGRTGKNVGTVCIEALGKVVCFLDVFL